MDRATSRNRCVSPAFVGPLGLDRRAEKIVERAFDQPPRIGAGIAHKLDDALFERPFGHFEISRFVKVRD